VGAQYGVKLLVDTLSAGLYVDGSVRNAWLGLLLLATLIAADNPAVAGCKLDRQLHLCCRNRGSAPRLVSPPYRALAELFRRTDARNADQSYHGHLERVFTLQNMFVWNVMPPCVATLVAIGFVVTVSLPMAGHIAVLAAILVVAMFHLGRRRPAVAPRIRRPRCRGGR
jgi:ATP-binding cassette subfamily B protein